MKKIVVLTIVIVAILAGVLLAFPLFFKPMLLDATKATLNKEVNATVNFEDFNFSLFANFPKVSIGLKEVVVTGKDEFRGDTLAAIPLVSAKLSLAALFNSSKRKIEAIYLQQPKLNLIVSKAGKANWDLVNDTGVKSENSASSTTGQPDSIKSFALTLDKIKIDNGQVVYTDREMNLKLDFDKINARLTGKMFGSASELAANGNVERFSLNYNSVNYISNVSLQTKTVLSIDFDQMNFTISENELLINRLPMVVSGTVKMPSDSIFFNLDIQTKKSGFANFLALVPPAYEGYLKELDVTGDAAISGSVKGFYSGENYPAFVLNLGVENGNLHFADLAEEIQNINASISVSKPQGVTGLTVVNVKKAHAGVRNNPVDLTLVIRNLFDNPSFDGSFIGTVNLNQLKNALPLDSMDVSGIVDANLFLKGNYSSIEKGQFENIKSDGTLLLDNFVFSSPAVRQKIEVPQGNLVFSPQNVTLRRFAMKIGQSDFNLKGKVTNYLNYLFGGGTINGNLQLNADFVNLNELLRLRVPAQRNPAAQPASAGQNTRSPAESSDTLSLAFEIPRNIDFSFQSKVKKAVFDHVPISEINGLITAKNGKLILKGLAMKMLDGELKLTGSYENALKNQPFFDFRLNGLNFDIPQAYRSLSGFRKMMPIAGRSRGKLSVGFNLKGRLSPRLKFVAPTINGAGSFRTQNVQIEDSPMFRQLRGILKEEKLKNVSIEDFDTQVKIENGNINLPPFTTKVAGQETTVSGDISAQNLLDLRLDFKVHRDAIGADIQNILKLIPGNENIALLPAGVLIKGPVGKPEVKVDLSETQKIITEATQKNLQKSLKELGKGLQKFFEK